jgi:uncharacterized protein YidB (DUF937 family)
MANDFLSGVLREALGDGVQGASSATPGLGGLLGGLFGGAIEPQTDTGAAAGAQPGQGALVAILLPMAIRWMQSNGGLGAVLQRFEQHGLGEQAASWVSNGENQPLDAQSVKEVVGADELSRLSDQLGLPHEEVASGLAQVIPQLINHVTPQGQAPQDDSTALTTSLAAVERFLARGTTPGTSS